MSDVSAVVTAFDEAIAAEDAQIAEHERERNRLVALRDQTAQAAEGIEVAAPVEKTEVAYFGARGWRYVRDIEIALQRGDKTAARLRDILGTSDLKRYLAYLVEAGKVAKTGERRSTPGRKVARRSDVYTWIGGEVEPAEAEAEAEAPVKAKPLHRRRSRRRNVPRGTIRKAVEDAIAEQHGAPFTKDSITKRLSHLNVGSVQSELARRFHVGLIELTGNQVLPASGKGGRIPEYRAVLRRPDENRSDEHRETRIDPGVGVTPGRKIPLTS